MAILIVTEESIPPVHRFCLSQKIAEKLGSEMEVHLVSLSNDPNYQIPNIYFHPVEVKNWSLFSLKKRIIANIKLIKKICDISQKYKVDLIYGWWPVAFVAAGLLKKPFAVDMPEFIEQMYRSFNQPFSNLLKFPLRLIQAMAAKKAKAIIVTSDIANQEWCKRGIPKYKLYTAAYGIETELFFLKHSLDIREKYGIPKDKILVMYHGDMGFDDGVDLLIKAVRDLDISCLCIGLGSPRYMNYLKSLANEHIIFTGWIRYSEIPGYLATCDIYVAAFRSSFYTNSTFPLKQMEAMAAGRPVICTKLEAFSKSVTDGYDIRLIEGGNLEELILAIKELARDKTKRNFLGNNAYRTAREKFDWRICSVAEIQMLKDIINRV